MGISIDLGIWSSVFVVPTDIVDKHIKLAGVYQLKVLLWLLRHSADSNIAIEDIATALNMHCADVKDALQYWVENGILKVEENEFSPNQITSSNSSELVENKNLHAVKKLKAPRIPQPDAENVVKRIEESEEIRFFLKEAQSILGKTLSNGDLSILLMLHDSYGLPIDVLIMLLQYSVEAGKTNIKYIDYVARQWAEENVDTMEKAEKKISEISQQKGAYNKIRKIVSLDYHSPSEEELNFCNCWINDWKFSDIMIREAYERCVNAIGKFNFRYINSILASWHMKEIQTIEQAKAEMNAYVISVPVENTTKFVKVPKPKPKDYATYNLEQFENKSIFDD